MPDTNPALELPRSLADVDATFMTRVLRQAGVISATNEVVSQQEKGVGMTAGYFSEIKKVKCAYKDPTDAQDSFVVKAWPLFEVMPKDAIKAMFIKDIKSYLFPTERFYPHPRAFLAAFDEAGDRWALVMEDADSFAEHKVHENELNLDEVMKMLPKLVDVAVAWEGCHEGPKADELAGLAVDFWASEANLALYKAVMPGGARLFDKFTTIEGSSVVGSPTWDTYLGGPGICELFTKTIDAFFASAHPSGGATCTLAHGDFRGDNIFFCEPNAQYPDGWLCIDFQLLFRGPIPSDLAYLMNSGSVLPEVYASENVEKVLHSFYEQFMAKTKVYKDYTYEKFRSEYATMATVLFVYYVGMGAAIWQQAATGEGQASRVELGPNVVTEADLTPEERRQRMWWGKTLANLRENFKAFGLYDQLKGLPENLEGLGPWTDLPPHLK
ncbi:MAG: oxidoreductase family protein [Dehalococcoidia bacterium]